MTNFLQALVFSCFATVSSASVYYAGWLSQILSCSTATVPAGTFIAYCQNPAFADYEHAALFRAMDAPSVEHLKQADVIVLGNSRMQAALSTKATRDFFDRLHARFFVLAFGYGGNAEFELPFFRRFDLHPKAVIINADHMFWTPDLSAAASSAETMTISSWIEYHAKANFPFLKDSVCRFASCTDKDTVVIRSQNDGLWERLGHLATDIHMPVLPNGGSLPETFVSTEVRYAVQHIGQIPVDRSCILMTATPASRIDYASLLSGLSGATGAPTFVADLSGLETLDGSHLNEASASRWTPVVLEKMRPTLERCLRRASSEG